MHSYLGLEANCVECTGTFYPKAQVTEFLLRPQVLMDTTSVTTVELPRLMSIFSSLTTTN